MRQAIALTCLGAVLATAAAVPAAALPSSDPTFDSVTWAHPSLVVSGMQMVRQTGTVHIVDPSATGSGGGYAWYFRLTSSGGSGSVRTYFTGATLTSGTVDDGTWTMTFYLSSTADGSWHVTRAESAGPTPEDYPVADTTSFTVTGHHQPRMSWAYVPNPVPVSDPQWLVKGRVYDADTGVGLAGVTVGEGEHETDCLYQVQGEGDGANFGLRAVTNANGYYSLPRRNGIGGLQCIGIVGKPDHNPDGLSVFVWFHQFRGALPAVGVGDAAGNRRICRFDRRGRRSCRVRCAWMHCRVATAARIDRMAHRVDGAVARQPAVHRARAATRRRPVRLSRVLPAVFPQPL